MTTGATTAGAPAPAPAPAPAATMLMLGWFGSGKSGDADEFLRRFLDINVRSKVVLNEVSAQTIVVCVCAQTNRFKNLVQMKRDTVPIPSDNSDECDAVVCAFK